MNMKDSSFPSRPALHHLLYHIGWYGSSQKGHLGFSVWPFITYHFYCGQEYAEDMHRHMEGGCSPSSLSLGDILEDYSALPQVASEEEQKSGKGVNGEELDINLGCHQVHPVHLRPSPVVEPGGMRVGQLLWWGQVNSGRGRKLRWKTCLHPHLQQGGMPLVEKSHNAECCFYLSYIWELTVPEPPLWIVSWKTGISLIPRA